MINNNASLMISHLSVEFGGVHALKDVTMRVAMGEVRGLIGPNGAGKTTLLNAVCRFASPTNGTIIFDGYDLRRVQPRMLARYGIFRTFQNLALLDDNDVVTNVLLGLHTRYGTKPLQSLWRYRWERRRDAEARDRVAALLEALELSEVAHKAVKELSYGQRKNVELARALIAQPKLLLLDEPTAGLNEAEIQKLRSMLMRLHGATRFSILIVTHHLEFLSEFANEVTVLHLGQIIAEGSPQSVRNDAEVRSAYLGE